MKWTTCNDCDSEYKVISDLNTKPQYCPFCGSLAEDLEDDEDEFEEEDDYE